jgi:amino-acid N-acetyltransferase
MFTRRAILPDAEAIHDIIREFSGPGTLLPRSLAEICENIRDFVVVEDEEDGIIGCGALHLYGVHLAEIRSIAIWPNTPKRGGGRLLIDALMAEADHHQVTCVCLFTRIPEFFAHMGFTIAQREELPDKIYKDCMNCPKLHACDEVAMVRGEIPQYSILAQTQSRGRRSGSDLVKLRA